LYALQVKNNPYRGNYGFLTHNDKFCQKNPRFHRPDPVCDPPTLPNRYSLQYGVFNCTPDMERPLSIPNIKSFFLFSHFLYWHFKVRAASPMNQSDIRV
jgi:hypothetical protein